VAFFVWRHEAFEALKRIRIIGSASDEFVAFSILGKTMPKATNVSSEATILQMRFSAPNLPLKLYL
jgi:hypothetical protein